MFWLAVYSKALPLSFSSKKSQGIAFLFSYYNEHMNINRKHYWNKEEKYALMLFISEKCGCVGKPLWWAHTGSACKPVVNNRCLIVLAVAPCFFRESSIFSRFPWLIYVVLNWFALLMACAYSHVFLFFYLFGLKMALSSFIAAFWVSHILVFKRVLQFCTTI